MYRTGLTAILLAIFLVSATSGTVKQSQNVDIYSFHISSAVKSRYATTIITSRVANKLNESQEVHFEVKIPKNAFISKFRMTIEGKIYDGVVKEKAEAQQQYSQAVSRGQSAGLIKTVGRTLEDFKTSVTIAALSKVTFELTYEELLKRHLGRYELLINAHPMQPVTDFKIEVHIQEKTGISFLEVKGDLSTNDLANAFKTTRADKDAWVNFYPTRDQQTGCKNCKNGLNGNLLVTYDVERQNPEGEMMVLNGYFVHYFAPSDIPRIPKNVVFIIDRSGSMHGRKIEQTRSALLNILSDLNEDDHFGLITFDHQIVLWKRELLKATKENLENAKSFVEDIEDSGSTDINAAVMTGVNMIKQHPREGTASILILLTDGDPTTGETNTERIMSNVRKAIRSEFPLYCLGFGYDVNFDFLTKMSLENKGVARRIYEDSDADLQLQGFYDEVAVPLLSDIQLNYTSVSNVTQTNFNLYFNGSEIVVSGQITDNSIESFTTEVIAISNGSKVTYKDTVMAKDVSDVPSEHDNFIQRLWAYLTVRQLLDRQVLLKGPAKEIEKNEVLRLSLKYQFVTPLTSMVVTKPQEEEVEVANKPKEGLARYRPPVPGRPSASQWKPRGSRPVSVSRGRTRGRARPASQNPMTLMTQSLLSPIKQRHSDDEVLEYETLMDDVSEDRIVHYFKKVSKQKNDDPVVHRIVPVPKVRSIRFLLPANDQPKPLCYDVPLPHKVRLLEDTSSELSMNGESLASRMGYNQMSFHYKKNHHLMINTTSINYRKDQDNVELLWGQTFNQTYTENVELMLRNDRIIVIMGDVHVAVLRHKKDGDAFLWPVVQRLQQDGIPTGIMGKASITYEEISGSSTPTLKIMGKDVKVSGETVTDYRSHSVPVVQCWLVPFQAVMDGEISDFVIAQL